MVDVIGRDGRGNVFPALPNNMISIVKQELLQLHQRLAKLLKINFMCFYPKLHQSRLHKRSNPPAVNQLCNHTNTNVTALMLYTTHSANAHVSHIVFGEKAKIAEKTTAQG